MTENRSEKIRWNGSGTASIHHRKRRIRLQKAEKTLVLDYS